MEYSLTIHDDSHVREELGAIRESSGEWGEQVKASELIVTATSNETAEAYTQRLPLVKQMLELELDPDELDEPGLGRITMNDAPPRTGDKLSKVLRQQDALEAVGAAMEKLFLAGFATQAAMTTEPELATERSNEEVLGLWHGLIFPFHSEQDLPTVLFAEGNLPSGADTNVRIVADRGFEAYLEAGDTYGFLNFATRNPRKMWRTGRAMTFAYFATSAGRALHRASTEAGKVG